jgi:hypothetical protein
MEVGDIYFMNLMFFSAPLSVLSTERNGELKQRERGEEVRERERERVIYKLRYILETTFNK